MTKAPLLSDIPDIIGLDANCRCPNPKSNWAHSKKHRYVPLEELDIDLSKYTAENINTAFAVCKGCGERPHVQIRRTPNGYGGFPGRRKLFVY